MSITQKVSVASTLTATPTRQARVVIFLIFENQVGFIGSVERNVCRPSPARPQAQARIFCPCVVDQTG